MSVIDNFKSLPVSAKRLLGIGIVLALVIALPLFIWAIITQKFLIIKHAASGEPTPTPTGTPPPTFCASVPMTISFSPTEQSGGPGQELSYDVSVTNNDDAGCGIPVVYLQAGAPMGSGNQIFNGWLVNLDEQNFLVSSHQTHKTKVKITSPTSGYSLDKYSIVLSVSTLNIPQNAASKTLYYNLLAQSQGNTAPAGEPNSCGGTCGSNYNCKGGLFCYQGFCRNPDCRTNTDCNCAATPTPTAKPKSTLKPLVTGTPISQVVYLTPRPYSTSSATFAPEQTETPATVSTEPKKPNLSFLLWIAGGSFLLALILLGINSANKNK